MTVQELIRALEQKPPDAEVQVWLPGSTIRLGPVFDFMKDGKIMIEGNVNPKSVLY